MTWGLLDTGLAVKPAESILSDIEAVELDEISQSLNLQPNSLIGVLNGVVTGGLSELWELLGALYGGMSFANATGDQLENLIEIRGGRRNDATSTVIDGVTVNVNAGFHADPGDMFASIVGTNDLHLFYNLDVVDNPGGTPADIAVDFICQDTGAIQALANTLTVKAVALSGWNSVTNPNDGIVGQAIETDPNARVRSQVELTRGGNATADAIRADVLAKMQPDQDPPTTVATTNVTVLHNTTETTDANGLPPHTLEVIARAPGATSADDQLLADLIFSSKAACDGTYSGNGTSKLVTDDEGNKFAVYYTRPTDTPLTVAITIVKDAATWPGDTAGIAGIKAAMVAYAATTYEPGVTVYAKRLADQAFEQIGVVDWTSMTVNGGGNLAIDVRHCATLSSSDISVTVT